VDFGYRVSVGAIYRAVLAVQGVSYAELEWLSTAAPVDDTDPEDDDTDTVLNTSWQHDITLTAPGTPARHYRRNVAANPTFFYFSTTDADGVSQTLSQVHIGDHMVWRPEADASSWMSFLVTALPVNNTTYYTLAVLRLDVATTIVDPLADARVTFSFIRYTPTPDSLSAVEDIATDELLIPRIAPLPAIVSADVASAAINANVATLTLIANITNPAVFAVGQTIDVAGVTFNPSVFNGRYVISAIGTNTVSYPKTNANISGSSTGTVKTVNLEESPVDYPDMSEAERTHDGLWVKAVGGLPNT
jgi:hypothetical protein